MTFDDLLHLDTPAEVVAGPAVCALVVGASAPALAEALAARENMRHLGAAARVVFGLPIHTAPYPVLIAHLHTERGTTLNQLSLFGWIEDRFIDEPRAEVIGLTPYGESPSLFLRDCDLDRPPEAYLILPDPPQGGGPERRFRRVGLVVISSGDAEDPLDGDDAALKAIEAVRSDAVPLVESLRAERARGVPLRHALRSFRKTADPDLLSLCDGWRVLARGARCARRI